MGAATAPIRNLGAAPGAIDAVCLMYTARNTPRRPCCRYGHWTINEAIMAAGQRPPTTLPQFQPDPVRQRAPTLAMQERIYAVLDNNADHAAGMTHCTVRKGWVTKTRRAFPTM